MTRYGRRRSPLCFREPLLRDVIYQARRMLSDGKEQISRMEAGQMLAAANRLGIIVEQFLDREDAKHRFSENEREFIKRELQQPVEPWNG